jgi:hypothetical protein
MKIELKNIQHSESLSQETNAFTANVYINGLRAAVASNQGHGGPIGYQPVNEFGRRLIKEAEEYCKILPAEKFTSGGKEYTLEMNLESVIDNLLEKHLQQKDLQKFRNKMERCMEQGLVYGVPDQQYTNLKFKMPIDMLLVHPNGPKMLRDFIITKIIPELKEGEKILNTNIPEKIYQEAGLSPKQYFPMAENKELKKVTKKMQRFTKPR